MAVSGGYTLHYSWGCSNNYGQSDITFNAGNTFSSPAGAGKWVQQDGTLLLSFDNGPAKYGGTVDGNVGSGAMSTFAGQNGCWYLTRKGTVGLAQAEAQSETHDVAGNKLKK